MWLSAPEYAKDFETVRDCREQGTSMWLFRHQVFQQWLLKSGQAVANSTIFKSDTIWVQGNPGFGKTILAGAVIGELETRAPVACRVFYFFFRREPTLDNSTALYRSILTQILYHGHDEEVFDRFAFAMKHSPTAQPTGTRLELFELLLLCTETIGQHYIVIDGIDECCDNASLISDLARLGSHSNLVLFSRPNVKPLQEKTTHNQRIDIGKSNTDDIRIFLGRKLGDLSDRDMLPEDASIVRYTEHLTKGADGMFLWARLMVDYLHSEALSDKDRHNTIIAVSMPEGLSEMYIRIIRLITQGYRANRNLAKWIIMWLMFSKRSLTATEVEDSTTILNEGKDVRSGRRDFDKAVVMACASLVEKATFYDARVKKQVPCFRFVHSTVKEYFLELFTENGISELSEDARRDVALVATSSPHSEICRGCLQYMLYRIPGQSLSMSLGKSIDARISMNDLVSAFPFSAYAMVLWIDHLTDTKDEIGASDRQNHPTASSIGNLFNTLNRFLGEVKVVKAWIEATYILTFSHTDDVERLKMWTENISAHAHSFDVPGHDVNSVLSAAGALARYLPELDKYWGASLRSHPGRLWTWDEIEAFVPSRFSTQSSATVHSLFAGNPTQAGTTLSSCYLCKVSESTPEFVGTLSIWTSKMFESYLMQGFEFPSFLQEGCIEGWMARYEIWSLGPPPKRLLIKDIVLNSAEVRLQLLQSLRLDTIECLSWARKWKVQFPVTISPDLQRLIILRTVYWLEPVEGEREGVLQSSLLDLNLESYSIKKWNAYHKEKLNKPALYTYWFKFGTAGNEILFVDRDNVAIFMFNRLGHVGPTLTSFRGETEAGPKKDEQGRTSVPTFPVASWPSWEDRNNKTLWQLEVRFHPFRPLVAYLTGRYVYLWAFRNAQSRPILCHKIAHASPSSPGYISFTSNSEQLVIQENRSELPIVLSLPTEILEALEDASTVDPASDKSEQSQRDSQLAAGPALDLSSFETSNRDLVSGAYVQTLASGESLGFTPVTSKDSASVLLWRETTEGFKQQKVEIVKFPAWEGMHSVTTSMRLPVPGETAITLVLNKAAQPESSFEGAHPEHFPAIITREVSSLRPPPVKSAESQRKRLNGGIDNPRRKSRRLTGKADGGAKSP